MNAGDLGVQKRELAASEIPETSIASSCVPINLPDQNAHANEHPPKPERPLA